MASVKQCDRCGVIIKYSERSVDPEAEWWKYSIERDSWPYSPLVEDIDLCDNCLHSLYNWFTKGEKRN